MMKPVRVTASVLKILLGALFVISAVSKYITIDIFEVYVYSFGFLSLGVSFYVARLVLALELVLGAALISNRHHRFTVVMTLLFLFCFIVFLTYAQLIGRTDSCHCFGDLMPFNPVQSILKNAVLILLLLFVFKYTDAEWSPRWWLVLIIYVVVGALLTLYMYKSLHLIYLLTYVIVLVMMCVGVLASFSFYNKWYVTTLLVLAPIVTIFILTPPDSWFFNSEEEFYNTKLFNKQLVSVDDESPAMYADTTGSDSVAVADTVGALSSLKLTEGRHVVAFFSPGCGYCRLSAQKLSTMVRRCHLDGSRLIYLFPEVRDTSRYATFYEEARSDRFEEFVIDKMLFVKITLGRFPLVLLVDDGDVVASYSYRNIDEGRLCEFLSQE